jgi:Trk-type K+ transport system membrane component
MTKVLIYGAVFAGGVAVGLLIAKQYAHVQAQSAIGSALGSVGLGGGVIENLADRLILPSVA